MKTNKIIRVLLLVLVLALFIWYFFTHQDQFQRIGNLNILQVVGILIGQSLVIISNIYIIVLFVRFVGKHIRVPDAARIAAYSSLVNFFGFLQGGVGLRAVFLKKQFDISIKRYFALTLSQYFVLFSIAGFMIVAGLYMTLGSQWTAPVLAVIFGTLAIAYVVARFFEPKVFRAIAERLRDISIVFQIKPLLGLFLACLLQLAGAMLANAIELSAVGSNVTIGGLLVYTGVSQFSILIALTPGAIGIREGLLLLIQNQMQLTTQDIILASTIDRVVYFITLGLFTPLALSARKKLIKN